MRVAWPSASSPVSAARYLTASILLLASSSPSAPRQALAFTSQQARRVAGSSSSTSSASSKRRFRSSTSSTAVRSGSVAATAMGSNDTGGSRSGVETAAGLPVFLESCSSAAMKPQQNTAFFHVFSGNEACDADSICSAICMAFLKQSTAAAAADAAADAADAAGADADAGGGEVVFVPVMPIPRADLALRREVLVLFELCGVDPSSVVFTDELDLSALQAEGRLRLTLMDHNAVSGCLSALGDAVVEIVDHHKDLEKHPGVKGTARDIAFDAGDGSGRALVGSCCTLVAERMLAQEQKGAKLLSSDVARLLLGVILVDTVNLDTEAKRATERDVAAAEQLSSRVSWKSSSPQGRSCTTPEELFDALRNAKFDPAFWEELSATDCLRYDYKSFHPAGEGGGSDSSGGAEGGGHQKPGPLKFGMSSVLCRLETLAEKGDDNGSGEELAAFAAARGVDSLAVMTVTLDEQENMKKELLVFTHTKRRCDQMREYFEGPHGEFLKLEATAPPGTSFGGRVAGGEEEDGGEAGGWFLRWEMGNARPSRKQVAPAIVSFYESLSDS